LIVDEASLLFAPRLGAAAVAASARNLVALGVVLVLPMTLYVGINEARFHRALGPPFADQVWTQMSADRRAALDANGGSLFSLDYVPSTALAYLRPDGVSLVRLFPFVDFRPERATAVGGVVFDTRDRTASIPTTMPALGVLALVGAWAMCSARLRTRLAPLRPLVVGGVVSAVGVLTISSIAHRYLGDFLPLLVPLAIVGLTVAMRRVGEVARPALRRAAWGAGAVLVAVSLWANAGLGLLVQRAYWAPDAGTRHAFLTFQYTLDERLFGDAHLLQGDTAPTSGGTRGELYVVADCRALYWQDSWVWVQIEPLADGSTPLCDRVTR
jgi:hypothetical protein